MYALVIDTSTKILYVSLVFNDTILYEVYIEGKNDHAKNIVACVDEALKTAKIEADMLNKVVIGYGPGSYTGVRMAVTVGKMIAVFKNIPLYTISTLELMASHYKGVCKCMIDARRGNAFACVIDTEKGKALLEEGLYSYDVLQKHDAEYEITDNSLKVDPLYCINHSKLVSQPELLVPNYLRETEAERNHHDS